ncbi:CRISPR-associated endonuclease Cas2 [candidate division KSB1 bacterium]|nr:CRISPR-associated endonuclease Cas2 [candidate division KSB1 bacterium]NIS27864.1 CRISPR-associated endonuclease Cas2 [candidate division KSB1 bacterium]NIT74747.1 CRISPR-associated endonuclease Cas2 [candidate division KSB1 bacterium]NIU28529.1 CRISPR-associated endonuclease Cas2 [candidate division KSB1 bacterium]NIU94332.1 CRISPR-associated endonuclease Cas2 [candidate division KSB1 bacterium]
MMVLVAYDVNTEGSAGQRRLRRVAKTCENYGQRVQHSVFECLVDPNQWTLLKHQLIKEIDSEKDSLRFYFLGKNWQNRVEHLGAKPGYNPEGPIII